MATQGIYYVELREEIMLRVIQEAQLDILGPNAYSPCAKLQAVAKQVAVEHGLTDVKASEIWDRNFLRKLTVFSQKAETLALFPE